MQPNTARYTMPRHMHRHQSGSENIAMGKRNARRAYFLFVLVPLFGWGFLLFVIICCLFLFALYVSLRSIFFCMLLIADLFCLFDCSLCFCWSLVLYVCSLFSLLFVSFFLFLGFFLFLFSFFFFSFSFFMLCFVVPFMFPTVLLSLLLLFLAFNHNGIHTNNQKWINGVTAVAICCASWELLCTAWNITCLAMTRCTNLIFGMSSVHRLTKASKGQRTTTITPAAADKSEGEPLLARGQSNKFDQAIWHQTQ